MNKIYYSLVKFIAGRLPEGENVHHLTVESVKRYIILYYMCSLNAPRVTQCTCRCVFIS